MLTPGKMLLNKPIPQIGTTRPTFFHQMPGLEGEGGGQNGKGGQGFAKACRREHEEKERENEMVEGLCGSLLPVRPALERGQNK